MSVVSPSSEFDIFAKKPVQTSVVEATEVIYKTSVCRSERSSVRDTRQQ